MLSNGSMETLHWRAQIVEVTSRKISPIILSASRDSHLKPRHFEFVTRLIIRL